MTPSGAIRKFCTECFGGVWQEGGKEIIQPRGHDITTCTDLDCSLYQRRGGKNRGNAELTAVKSIRAFCLTCVEGAQEVKNCGGNEPNLQTNQAACALYQYRLGYNPRQKAAGLAEYLKTLPAQSGGFGQSGGDGNRK